MQAQQYQNEINQGKAKSDKIPVRKEIKMNRREQLQDRYEDALFALLMDEIATKEGKKAIEENERLKNDPSAVIPEDVDRRCLQTIRRHFAKQRAYAAGRFTVKAMKRVVMAAGLAALLFTGAFAASETVRVNTLNLIVEVFDTNTTFRFMNQPEDVMPRISVGWLPEGFTLDSYGYDETSTWYQYCKDDKSIYISWTEVFGTTVGVDTENAEVEYVEINGIEAMLIEKDISLQLVWAEKSKAAFITLFSVGISQDDLIDVANGLKC